MYCPPRAGWAVARRQPQILLTLLLALPCNVHPSPPAGVEQHAHPRPLPSRPESGTSRQLQVTPGGSVRGDLLVSVPLTLLLPTIGYNTEYKSRWREGRRREEERREKKNISRQEGEPMHSKKLAKQELLFDSEKKEYTINPFTGPLLSRIDIFFFFLQVNDDVCRQRAICEIVQNQLKFSPLSDFLISLFRKSRKGVLNDETPSSIRWDQYFYSAYLGLNSDGSERKCQTQYDMCPLSADMMINVPALKIWQFLSEKISIRITDQ